jgi:hypothetical protein
MAMRELRNTTTHHERHIGQLGEKAWIEKYRRRALAS